MDKTAITDQGIFTGSACASQIVTVQGKHAMDPDEFQKLLESSSAVDLRYEQPQPQRIKFTEEVEDVEELLRDRDDLIQKIRGHLSHQ
ncbi:hypothetical protein [Paenibacillus koleovorans]|uniref:hypothetical protein n=1 Tax=Paenibacillus koleovorans TaxID=121608 RepID=UPI000FDC4DD4|nr:hypothetical protein [Paenibacillus koleovorans]